MPIDHKALGDALIKTFIERHKAKQTPQAIAPDPELIKMLLGLSKEHQKEEDKWTS